ncbi:F1-ATP synthase assembly protein [Plenodomus tracheiphilus IPT5]|uniref:F1-ATP synthase assembly protein n=1 Tax=Plenodomus tracheiphilus IPT5 TaxID=1408161 RepID=A0A6A7AR88_9PLEO|nr:F1-ATP synthase assembly protein [Plenodomus tracheiphilus IPT5]
MESLRPALRTLRLPHRPYRPLYQCLHTTASRGATPLPHPSVPGPPPATPTPQPSEAMARVARKRKQADMMKQAREMRDVYSPGNKPKNMLAKRFWKDVHVKEGEGGLQVFLDHRPVRLPNKQILTVPPTKHQLATAIALEWDLLMSAQQALKSDYIPMTSLAARAIDIEAADAEGRANVRDDILGYFMRVLATDTLLCWAPEKVMNDVTQDGKTLRELQEDVATKIIAYLTTHVWPGVQIKPTLDPDSIIPVSQPELTQQVIRGWCAGLPAFELAGLERAVLASKSLLVSTRLIHEWAEAFAQSRKAAPANAARFGIEEAAEASSLEVTWQTRQWGEVEDTHDVEKEDLRRQLGSAIVLVGGTLS